MRLVFPSSGTGTWHPHSLGDDSVCTLTGSWLNVRLQKEVCSALLLGLFLDGEARQKANLCIYSTGV